MSDIDADLRALAKQLPYEKPDAERREAVRSSLLVAATERTPVNRKRWLFVGGGFAAGALAAAAIAIVVISSRESAPVRAAHARIDAPATAQLEHTVTATATGTDEVVRVRAGVVRVAVPASMERGDRVRMQTADAEVEATGSYEAAVVDDRLERVTVNDGTARITARIDGQQQQVFLSAGQTWRPKIVTAEIELPTPAPQVEPKVEAAPQVEAKPAPAQVEANPAPATATTKPAPAQVEAKPAPAQVEAKPAPATATTKPAATSATTKPAPATATTMPAPATATTKPATATSATTKPARATAATKSAKPATATSATTKPAPATAAATMKPAPTTTTPADPATERLPAVTELDIKPTKQPTPTEQHFQAGWALLRAGKAREAAVELGAAAAGDDALAVDARYFQAVALVRAGDPSAAERVLVGFLDHAPTSLRRGRAAVMLGKLLADRGAVDAARKWFESAATDADPAIAAAARAHLDSLR